MLFYAPGALAGYAISRRMGVRGLGALAGAAVGGVVGFEINRRFELAAFVPMITMTGLGTALLLTEKKK